MIIEVQFRIRARFIRNNAYSLSMTLTKTITISREEYDYLKRLEEAAQEELLHSIKRGLEEAAKGRLRVR